MVRQLLTESLVLASVGGALGVMTAHWAVALLKRAAHLPVDEHRALQFGEPAEQWPAGNLALGDERAGDQRPEDRDVEIGDVVGGEQHRTRRRRLADAAHPQTKNAAAAAVVKAREARHPTLVQQEADRLHRHQQHGEGEIDREPPQPQRRRADALYAAHVSFDCRS